jgi:hypothetical protein
MVDRDVLARWQDYLQNLEQDPVRASSVQAQAVRYAWEVIQNHVPVGPPVAGPNHDGSFALEWTTNRVHVELEVDTDGRYRWWRSGDFQGWMPALDDAWCEGMPNDFLVSLDAWLYEKTRNP